MVLVDTDVMVDLLRQYPPAVQWLESLGQTEIALPGLVVMELIQGCRTRAEQRRLTKAVAPYRVIWPLPEAADQALNAFTRFHLSHGVGIIDALIGQLAVSLNAPLYTHNQRHYSVIPGITVKQPYRRD